MTSRLTGPKIGESYGNCKTTASNATKGAKVEVTMGIIWTIIIGFITWPVVWIWSIYDAYKRARIRYEVWRYAETQRGSGTPAASR